MITYRNFHSGEAQIQAESGGEVATQIGGAVFTGIDDFSAGRAANDDRTLVVSQRKMPTQQRADELTIKADHESLRKIKPWLLTLLSELSEEELGGTF